MMSSCFVSILEQVEEMKNTQEKICRLCFTSVVNGFKDLDSDKKDMIEIVLPDLDLNIFGDAILCCQCSNNLLQAFAFKSACLEIEDNIHNYTNNGHVQVNLEKLLGLNDMDEDNESMKIGNMRICRTCLDIVKLEAFTRIDGYENHLVIHMLRKSLPELDCQLTMNPGICDKCKHSASNTSDFISQCMDLEAKISEYVKFESPETFSIYNAFKYVFSKKESVFLLNSDVTILNQETDEIVSYENDSKIYEMCWDSEKIIKSSDQIVSYDAAKYELCDPEKIIKSQEDECEDSDFIDDSVQNTLVCQSENFENLRSHENITNDDATEANKTSLVDETTGVNEILLVTETPLVHETEISNTTKANDTTEANDKTTEANDIPREDEEMNIIDALSEKCQVISEPSTSSSIENTTVDTEISSNKRKYDSSDDVYIYEDNIDTIRTKQPAKKETNKPRRYNTRRSCRLATKILDLDDSSSDPDFVPEKLTISDSDEFPDPSVSLARRKRSQRERRKKQKKGTSQQENNVNNNVYLIFPNGTNIQDSYPMFQIRMTPTTISAAPNTSAYSTPGNITMPVGPSILESMLSGNPSAYMKTPTRPQYIMSPSMTGTSLQQRIPNMQIRPIITPLCEINNAEALNLSKSVQGESVVRQRTSVTSFKQTSYVTHNQPGSSKSRNRGYVPNELSNILSLNSNAKTTTIKNNVTPTFSNRKVNQMNSIDVNKNDTVSLTTINKTTRTTNRKGKRDQTTPSPNITNILDQRNLPDIIFTALNELNTKQTKNNAPRNASTSSHQNSSVIDSSVSDVDSVSEVPEQQMSSNSNRSKTLIKKATKTTNPKGNRSQTTPVQSTKKTNTLREQSGGLSTMILRTLDDLKMKELAKTRRNTARNTSTPVHQTLSIIEVPAFTGRELRYSSITSITGDSLGAMIVSEASTNQVPSITEISKVSEQQTPSITDVDSVTTITGDGFGTVEISKTSANEMSSNIGFFEASVEQTSLHTDVESVTSITGDALSTMKVFNTSANQGSTITEVSKSSEQQTPSFNDINSITPNTDDKLGIMEMSEASENQITAVSEAPEQRTPSITDSVSLVTGDALRTMNFCESSADQMSITDVSGAPEQQTPPFTDVDSNSSNTGDTLGTMNVFESVPNQISLFTEVSEASERKTLLITDVGSATPNSGYALGSMEVDGAPEHQTSSITDVDSEIIEDSLRMELSEASKNLMASITEVSKTPEIQTSSITDSDTLKSITGDGFGDTEDSSVTSLKIQSSEASVQLTSSFTDFSQTASVIRDHATASEVDSVTPIISNNDGNDDAPRTSSFMTVVKKPKRSPVITDDALETMSVSESSALQTPSITGDDLATISIRQKPEQANSTTSVQQNSSVTDTLSISNSKLIAMLNASNDSRAISKQTEVKKKPQIVVADIDLTSDSDDAPVSQTPTENVHATSITDPTDEMRGFTSRVATNNNQAGARKSVDDDESALARVLGSNTLLVYNILLLNTHEANVTNRNSTRPALTPILPKTATIPHAVIPTSFPTCTIISAPKKKPAKTRLKPGNETVISKTTTIPHAVIDTRGHKNSSCADTVPRTQKLYCAYCKHVSTSSRKATKHYIKCVSRSKLCIPMECPRCNYKETDKHLYKRHIKKCGKIKRDKAKGLMVMETIDLDDDPAPNQKKPDQEQAASCKSHETQPTDPNLQSEQKGLVPTNPELPSQHNGLASTDPEVPSEHNGLASTDPGLVATAPNVHTEHNGQAPTSTEVPSEHNKLIPPEPGEHNEFSELAATEMENDFSDSRSFIKDIEELKGRKKMSLGFDSKVCSAQKGLVVLKCDLCSFNARTYEKIEGHIQKEHIFKLKQDGVYQCNQCESCFMNLEDTAKHLKHSHQSDYYKIYHWCVKCATVFDKISDLQNHSLSCSFKDKVVRLFKSNNNIFCLVCEFETDDVGKARSHLKCCRTKNIIVSDEVIEID